MNERIKQLVKQATLPGYMLGQSYVQSRLDEQKFAELIVGECAEIALVDGQSTGNFDTFNKIQKHFGFKE
jgi:hypothetical protein